MSLPNVAAARAYVLGRLDRELATPFTYHCSHHTRDDVVPAALRLAQLQGLSEEDTALLETGALFHDLGFIERASEHEKIGAGIARQVLPGFGYHAEQIEVVVGIIMATRMPQSPRTLLEELMADADLDVLGRTDDFFERNDALFLEWQARHEPISRQQWYVQQLKFLEGHSYFTDVAKALRDEGKRKNIAEMRRRLQALTG